SGLGLLVALPRPGERGAERAAARARLAEALWRVAEAEAALARDVHVACADVLELEALSREAASLTEVARRTSDYAERAREAGAATAIQANLAAGELLVIETDRVRLEARLGAARRHLNALLGLPPDAET